MPTRDRRRNLPAGWAAAGQIMPGIAVALAAVTGGAWWWATRRRNHRCGPGCSCTTTVRATEDAEPVSVASGP